MQGKKMNLALVGWPSNTGVGMELRDAARYLPARECFLMNHPGKPMDPEWKARTAGEYDLPKKMEAFVDAHKIDTVLTWETPGHPDFPALWQRKGVRWFCMVHWDWFAPQQMATWKKASLLVPFEGARLGLRLLYDLDATVIPVPVDLERLRYRNRETAARFVTVYAMGGPGDRRSIGAVVEAWKLLGAEAPPLSITAQKAPPELEGVSLPPQVKVHLGVAPTAWDLYADSDVAVSPSKYEGVGLSLIEAQACGLPVVTTDMDPMRSVAPDHLVRGTPGEIEIMMGHRIATTSVDPVGLARKVRALMGTDIRGDSAAARQRVESSYSWRSLRDRWIGVLEGR